MNARELILSTEKILLKEARCTLGEASPKQLHEALAQACMVELAPNWTASERRHAAGRRAFYLSAEYLVGRMVFNNLLAMGVLEEVRELLAEKGVDLNSLEDVEDMALGNGGLGRLAACFLDSAATHDIPLDGYGLRYKFGLFRQTFENCRQMEAPDDWTKWGDAWSVRRDDLAVTVPMRTGRRWWPCPTTCRSSAWAGATSARCGSGSAESRGGTRLPTLFNEQKYAQAFGDEEPRRGHHPGALPQRHAARRQADAHQAAVHAASAPACRTSCGSSTKPASRWRNFRPPPTAPCSSTTRTRPWPSPS